MERLPYPQHQPEETVPSFQPISKREDEAGRTTEPVDPENTTRDLEITEEEKQEMNEALDLFYPKERR